MLPLRTNSCVEAANTVQEASCRWQRSALLHLESEVVRPHLETATSRLSATVTLASANQALTTLPKQLQLNTATLLQLNY